MRTGALLAQLRVELVLASRRGEALLVTLAIPPALLAFFASGPVQLAGGEAPVAFLLPGMIALAVMAAAMVSLGIGTAYERHYGVLKRLGALPGSRAILVVAKTLAVVVVELIQVAVLVLVAGLLGWTPAGDPLAVGVALFLGTAAFTGIGLWMAGTLRADVTLALVNALFIGFLLVGGIVVPADQLPGLLADVAPWLPAAALSEALRSGLAAGPRPAPPSLLLAGWAIVTLLGAAITFRVEE